MLPKKKSVQSLTQMQLPAEKQKPALFVLRFLVSKLWYDEARDAFFARTTPWTASVFGFTLVNEVAANVTRAAIRIVCVRCLELFMNEPHTFPRLRDLHLKVETDMLEEIGLDVWDKGLTEEDIRACRLSAWTSKMHQLRNLIIDFEMADSYLVGAEARGQCSANLAIIRKTWTKMLFEGQQEHQPVPASSASDADSKLAIGTHDVVVPDTPLPDSSPATPLAHRSIKVNAACSPRQSFAPRRSSTENLRIVQEC